MELSELQTKQSSRIAVRALREHFNHILDLDRLDISNTRTMLRKVRGLLSESRSSTAVHSSHQNPAYLKLLMMEQALSGHLGDLTVQRAYRASIIVENEEVEKSQVVLAAQDILDRINKMLEDVGIMSVKDLPAVVDGVENEIGVNEAKTYKDAASAALNNLRGALEGAQSELQAAIDGITGQGGGESFAAPTGAEGEEAGAALGGLEGGAEPALGAPEAAAEVPAAPEAPEDLGGAGRAKR